MFKIKGSMKKEDMPMDPEVLQKLQDGTMKARKNPGVMRLNTIIVPERLENAVKLLVRSKITPLICVTISVC